MQTREKNPTLQAAYGPQSSSFQPLVSVERFRFSCPSGNTKDDKSSIILAWGKMGKLAFILLLPFLLHQVQNAPMLPPGCSAPPVPAPSSHLILLLIRRLQNHPCCQPSSWPPVFQAIPRCSMQGRDKLHLVNTPLSRCQDWCWLNYQVPTADKDNSWILNPASIIVIQSVREYLGRKWGYF